MTSSGSAHDQIVRREFTRQAPAYAALPAVTDPDRIDRLIRAVQPKPEARVLDVATGPGYVAMGFAARCREVIGVDLTAAPLELAESMRVARDLTNLRFMTGDAQHLEFEPAYFDVVVCRLAFHHFEQPARVLAEMARVCQVGGTVAVEDLVASEHPARGAYQNHFERLRDPSHTRALPLSELLRLFTEAGLEMEQVYTDRFIQPVERWLGSAETPPGQAAEVRGLLARDEAEDLSGTTPYHQGGAFFFVHRAAAVIGRKLAG
ncbi:MAG TPA: methyltransferase domain-containing protein [Chloroflexota bacterium]|nr:methyltransferase domain-containing protein [Chloroflexota bacterium]